MIIALVFGQLYMQYSDITSVGLSTWQIIVIFSLLFIFWGIYIFLEAKRGNLPKPYINSIFLVLLAIGLISIILQPANHSIDMILSPSKNIKNISIVITNTHYLFFSLELVGILLFVYNGLFILPKRFTKIKFFTFLGIAIIGLSIAMILYSYFTEYTKYSEFIKLIIAKITGKQTNTNIYDITVESFVLHRNAFGMISLSGIIFCFINHSISKKWYYYLIAIYLFVSMLFSYSKTSILIAVIIFAVYILFRLIYTFKDHKKRNAILLIIYLVLIFGIVGICAYSYISKGKFLPFIYKALNSLFSAKTLVSRTYIWYNTMQLINQHPLYYAIGRGFGTINYMLLPMNIANGDTPLSFPTHNGFLNLFAEGGVLYLLAYLGLICLYLFTITKCNKYNKSLVFAITLGLFSFLIYSIVETIHYFTYAFIFLIFVLQNIISNNDNK